MKNLNGYDGVILKIDGGLFGWSTMHSWSAMKFDQQTRANMDSRLQSLISPQQYKDGLNTCEAKFEKIKFFTTSWAIVGVFLAMITGGGLNMVMPGGCGCIAGSFDSAMSIIAFVAGVVLLVGYVVALGVVRKKGKGEIEAILMGEWSGLANVGATIEMKYGKKHGHGAYIGISNLGPQVELSGAGGQAGWPPVGSSQ